MVGGLGNQLFQLAFGLNVERIHFRNVKFVFLDLSKRKKSTTKRNFSLVNLVDETEKTIRTNIWLGICRLLSQIIPSIWIREESLHEDTTLRLTKWTCVATGYFQHLKSVESVWPELQHLLSRKEDFWKLAHSTNRRYLAVHLRFGDYLRSHHTRAFHGLTAPVYYKVAIQKLIERTGITEVLVLSDDHKAASQYVNKWDFEPNILICLSPSEDEWADLGILAGATGVVCSNSTFSWWGAFLATKVRGATVVVPRPWYADENIQVDQLLHPDWIILQREIIKCDSET